ncbi:MAG: hypothetical protein GY711_31865 [bacterium]|nr:hypothetical protein [bacterium]
MWILLLFVLALQDPASDDPALDVEQVRTAGEVVGIEYTDEELKLTSRATPPSSPPSGRSRRGACAARPTAFASPGT